MAVHDFDEIGVPAHPNAIWRCRAAEAWVRRALVYHAEQRHLLLSAQLPYGELLACPSTPALHGVAACLLDCDDYERIDRIQRRGSGTEAATHDMLRWAAWLRTHARDPQWRQDVVLDSGDGAMEWERWTHWQRGDPRWQAERIDTTRCAVEETIGVVQAWIQRALQQAV